MIYVAGIVGFIFGFLAGQYLLLYLLKDRSKEDLLENSHMKWTYGLFNWLLAGVGAYGFVLLYKVYFIAP